MSRGTGRPHRAARLLAPARAVYHLLPAPLRLRLRLRWRYFRSHGHVLSLAHPQAFTEKVHWRMLNDRRALLEGTCDKLAMKELAVAAGIPGLRVPRTLWTGTDLRELAEVELPERWVLKPNHRSGKVEFGAGRADAAALVERTARWLEETKVAKGEWAYGRACRCFLVEEMIGTQPPDDFKFFVFGGAVRVVSVHTDRFTEHRSRIYDPHWRPVGRDRACGLAPLSPCPQRWSDMLHAASVLGAPYDFMRVDLYHVDGQVWFSELTPYPGAGITRMDPPELDDELGSYWHLPRSA